MKKFISMLLAGIMTISSMTFAATFEDVNTKHENYEAIETLQTLEIVSGYSDEEYGPDKVLNRAELCTLMVKALYPDDIHYGSTNFVDVDINHWARKYIDTAVENKLMVGYGNGMFGPEDKLTYTQIARVILNALGYGDLIWPVGVDTVALELGLYDNIEDVTKYSSYCTRAHAAQIIYNAFDAKLVKSVAGVVSTTTKDTFLEDLLGYKKIEDFRGYIDEKENEIIDDGRIYIAYEDLRADKKAKLAEKYKQTDILVSEEKEIEAVADNKYKFVNTNKTYKFDWEDVVLFINDKEVDATTSNKKYFTESDNITASFNADGELIAIFVEYDGSVYLPTEFSKLPKAVREDIENDKDYNAKTSTITYFFEDETYVISNDIICGFVAKRTNKTITVGNEKLSLGLNHGVKADDYVVVYFDIDGEIAGHEVLDIDEVYFYDIDNMIVHTWECAEYNENSDDDCWMTWSTVNEAEDLLEDGKTKIVFEACDDCHAAEIDIEYRVIAPRKPIVEIPESGDAQ